MATVLQPWQILLAALAGWVNWNSATLPLAVSYVEGRHLLEQRTFTAQVEHYSRGVSWLTLTSSERVGLRTTHQLGGVPQKSQSA
jgi:hypothetical protein